MKLGLFVPFSVVAIIVTFASFASSSPTPNVELPPEADKSLIPVLCVTGPSTSGDVGTIIRDILNIILFAQVMVSTSCPNGQSCKPFNNNLNVLKKILLIGDLLDDFINVLG